MSFDKTYIQKLSFSVRSYGHKEKGNVGVYFINEDHQDLMAKILKACQLESVAQTNDFDVVISFGVFSDRVELGMYNGMSDQKNLNVWLQCYSLSDINKYPELKKHLWNLLKQVFIN